MQGREAMQTGLRENGGRFKALHFIDSRAKREVTGKKSEAISGTKHNVFHRRGYKANYWSL